MTGIVLVTHEGLGEALRYQAENILDQSVRMTTVAIGNGIDPDQGLVDVLSAIALSTDGEGVLVLTDLPGATPHNLAVRAAEQQHAPVVSGLNLSMLLKVLNHASQPADQLAELALLGGRQGITRK